MKQHYSRDQELQQAAHVRALVVMLAYFGIILVDYIPCELDELAIREGRQ